MPARDMRMTSCLHLQVCGEPRKKHHSHGRWDRFIDWTTRGLHIIQDIAVKKRRNYILDQVSIAFIDLANQLELCVGSRYLALK